ncbi:MAG: aminotransferase [Gemmatimonadetes bacterium]|nr:aminotransferase [Gemmatimonadota bacterium]
MENERSDIDPGGLLEYSVVFSDRSLNHMSQSFQGVMRDVSSTLKRVYKAQSAVLIPGGGTYGMEAVARQFATDKSCLVIRNGWFSYRWTQIFEMGSIPSESTVLTASQISEDEYAPFCPPAVDEVIDSIRRLRPEVVFAPHVETAAGIILPDDYITAVSEAVHEVSGLFVLDCVASGALWVDMEATGVDVLISAPQKGWSGSPCSALVMLSPLAVDRLTSTSSTSFATDLRKWKEIMEAYENGAHAYHATMPTDSLRQFHRVMEETERFGFLEAQKNQEELGRQVRSLLSRAHVKSVAGPGFEAPSVVVSYTDDPGVQNGAKFSALGIQVAAGVPLMCNEPQDFQSFRIGLFGLDKLANVDRTVRRLENVLGQVLNG